jgi:DNA-directed RNA polymerase specialized sigma24 family protein
MDRHAALASAMDRYAEGDETQLDTLYDLLAPQLLAFFSEHGCPSIRCEQLLQHTLLEMHRGRRWYARGSDGESWALALGSRAIAVERRPRTTREGLLGRASEALRALLARGGPQTVPEAPK